MPVKFLPSEAHRTSHPPPLAVILRSALADLGVHAYRRGKDPALFAWLRPQLPDPQSLTCISRFALADGT